jgi:transposase
MSERTGVSGDLGRGLLARQKALFEVWYQVRNGTLERQDFMSLVAPIQQEIHCLLEEGAG